MTTPTQARARAQITWLRSLAEKGGKDSVDAIDARSLGRVADTLAALTAAAEVGELAPVTNSPERLAGYLAEHKELTRLATVERCAQVAENMPGDGISGPADPYGIAAAIRALKD